MENIHFPEKLLNLKAIRYSFITAPLLKSCYKNLCVKKASDSNLFTGSEILIPQITKSLKTLHAAFEIF